MTLRPKCLLLAVTLSFLCCSFSTMLAQTREQRLKNHLYYLASDSLHGRKAGSADAQKVADYLVAEYSAMGLKPFFEEGWKMTFKHKDSECGYFTDIIGVIEGTDPVLKDEYIVLGAHYDHIGINKNKEVCNGADDNASGTATLLELTRELLKDRQSLRRSVIIAAFDAEELGLFGSEALVKRLKDEKLLDKVKLMMSIDMVGWLEKGGGLTLEGTGTFKDAKKYLVGVTNSNSLNLQCKKYETSMMTATDTQPFAESQIPTLAVTTGLKSPYHKPADDAELIDYAGMDKICGYLAEVTHKVADDPQYAASGKLASKHSNSFRPFELGIAGGMGSSSMNFRKSGLSTSSAFSYSIGLAAKINFAKHWALRVDGRYEKNASRFPVESDLYNTKGRYSQNAISVPAYLLFQIKSGPMSAFVGFGGFYRHVVDSYYSDKVNIPYSTRDNQYGTAFILGFGLGKWSLEYSHQRSINQIPDIKADMKTSAISIVRWF